jgi:hypothetical protein
VRRKRKASGLVPDSNLVGRGILSTGKMGLSAGEYCLHFQDKVVEE